MRERILAYLDWMNDILINPPKDLDYKKLLERHMAEIKFFQHERFIHLIVMFLFAIATVIVLLVTVTNFQISLVALFLALLVLLIPYIRHYFLLENGVQKMYYQYDVIYKRIYPDQVAPTFLKIPKELHMKGINVD
ncbi:MAG: hypothetical protein K5656_06775 [Lachnospiraceae bacterium]|nr:hypothetical protein [Lachnospiraceae bacterium]